MFIGTCTVWGISVLGYVLYLRPPLSACVYCWNPLSGYVLCHDPPIAICFALQSPVGICTISGYLLCSLKFKWHPNKDWTEAMQAVDLQRGWQTSFCQAMFISYSISTVTHESAAAAIVIALGYQHGTIIYCNIL